MYNRDNILNENNQDRPNIFEDKKYIRSFCNRDFHKNLIVAKDVYVDMYNKKEEYTNTNVLVGDIDIASKSFVEPNIVQMNTSYIVKHHNIIFRRFMTNIY